MAYKSRISNSNLFCWVPCRRWLTAWWRCISATRLTGTCGHVQLAGLETLMRRGLERYSEFISDEEDFQDEWVAPWMTLGSMWPYRLGSAIMRCIGQHWMNRIWHDSSALEQTSQIYFLVYHELKAHVQWLVSRPAEVVISKRFQVGKWDCIFYVLLTCQGVGFIRMLVLTLGFLLLTGYELGHRLGAFQIVCRMMDLIGAKLTWASDVG